MAFVALLSGCAPAPESASAAAFPEDPYVVIATEGGAFLMEARTSPLQPPQRGLIDVELRVRDAAGEPAGDLAVAVEPWMPDMGHGASTHPEISEAGGGRYLASEVSFFMPGRWELRVAIGGDPKDRAVLSFQIP